MHNIIVELLVNQEVYTKQTECNLILVNSWWTLILYYGVFI